MGIYIRPVNELDREFIISLAERFNEFAFMGWRDPEAMNEAQVRMAKESFDQKDSNSERFIAEDENQVRLGFLHMSKNEDYFTGEKQGYISSIVVSKEGEGKGIAKKLMNTAEEWCIQKGYKQTVLHVFANNERAIRFYKHLKYETEIVKMVKEINTEEDSSRGAVLKNKLSNIVESNYKVPEEMTDLEAVQLVIQALGSTDGELRDDLAYSILNYWLLKKKLLISEELYEILFQSISENRLFAGIEEKEGDSVFLRTFSSLLVALILMRDNQENFLKEEDIKLVLEKVVSYCKLEVDLRGYVKGKGWAHAAAHMADVMDELAQNRYVQALECEMLWKGVTSLFKHAQHVFDAEEDERIATVIISMIEKGKISVDTLKNWIIQIEWPLDGNSRIRKTNMKHFIRSVYIRLKNKEAEGNFETLFGLEKEYNSFVK